MLDMLEPGTKRLVSQLRCVMLPAPWFAGQTRTAQNVLRMQREVADDRSAHQFRAGDRDAHAGVLPQAAQCVAIIIRYILTVSE